MSLDRLDMWLLVTPQLLPSGLCVLSQLSSLTYLFSGGLFLEGLCRKKGERKIQVVRNREKKREYEILKRI